MIRRRSEPKQLKLQPLWTCTELKSPGNVLLVDESGQPPRILVFEGWRTIAEVDAAGQGRRPPCARLPEQAAVALCPHGGRQGRPAILRRQLRRWRRRSSCSTTIGSCCSTYPPPGETPLGVLDLALADLGEADGTPEMLVASVGDQGLVARLGGGRVRCGGTGRFPTSSSPPSAARRCRHVGHPADGRERADPARQPFWPRGAAGAGRRPLDPRLARRPLSRREASGVARPGRPSKASDWPSA